MVELGGGYFGPLDKSDEVTLNFYAGLGFGKFSFDDSGLDRSLTYHRFYKANVFKFYIQPGINFMPVGRFKVSLVSRLSFFLHNNISTSYTKDELDYFYLTGIDNRALFVWEPSSAIQFSIPKAEWIKAEAGATFGVKLPGVATGRGRFSNFSIGLTFDPVRLFRK